MFTRISTALILRVLVVASLLFSPFVTTSFFALAAPALVDASVEAGGFFNCGLRPDGSIQCWGDNDYGQAVSPSGSFTQVDSGRFHACALRESDSAAVCWGSNTYGEIMPPSGAFTQISAGGYHTCGLRSDGSIQCWGRNTQGQSVPPTGTYSQVSAGNFHTCAVRTDGAAVCWGFNDRGQTVAPGGQFTTISAGIYHNCGIRPDNSLACWGDNLYGQATPPGGTFSKVSAGGAFSCGLRDDGTPACWGFNGDERATPTPGIFVYISLGVAHGCALRADGARACWGLNTDGQAPRPLINPASLPEGQLGQPYSQLIEITGETPPYTVGVILGSLPGGLSYNPLDGTLGGVPTQAGTFPFAIEVVDSNPWPFIGARPYILIIRKISPSVSLAVHNAAENMVASAEYGETLHMGTEVLGDAGEPTGTVTFLSYSGSTCAGTPAAHGTVALSGGQAHPSNSLDPNAGLLSFKVSYSGDATYSPADSACMPFNVAQRLLAISADADDREYNGGVLATAGLSDDRLPGDSFTIGYNATFADKHVGPDKPVTVGSFTLSGPDAANYTTAGASVMSSASITPRPLNIQAAAQDKVYDGVVAAALALTDDRVPEDALEYSYDATFDDENVGDDKTVTLHWLTLSGADAANYSRVEPAGVGTADILPRPITVSADPKFKPSGAPDPLLTYTITAGSLIPGDSLDGTLTRQPGEALGAYDILQGTLEADPNYTLIFVGADLYIVLQTYLPVMVRP